MKLAYVLGMLALAGLVFLALGAPSASAQTGGATPAETHPNVHTQPAYPPSVTPGEIPRVQIDPTPPAVAPTPIDAQPWPAPLANGNPTPIPSVGPGPVGIPSNPQPIDPNPSVEPVPVPALPIPLSLVG